MFTEGYVIHNYRESPQKCSRAYTANESYQEMQ